MITAANHQFPEDSAHASGDKGTQVLAVRQDAAGSLVLLDGNYAPLQVNSQGQLKVTSNLFPPVKFAVINASLLTNTIVPLVVGKKIRVLNYVLTAKDEVRATWRGTATLLSGALFLKETAQPINSSGSQDAPLFETPVGEPLDLILSGLVLVTGHLAYVEV